MNFKHRKKSDATSLRKRIETIKRRKLVSQDVVNLEDFRTLNRKIESKTILVVDDDEIMRDALKRILEKEGYRVLLAEDGMELSKLLESSNFDLILLDINLPWVDGFELCRIIKSQGPLQDIPLILISARKDREDIERGFEAGCNNYISKPFDIDHMTEIVDKALTSPD